MYTLVLFIVNDTKHKGKLIIKKNQVINFPLLFDRECPDPFPEQPDDQLHHLDIRGSRWTDLVPLAGLSQLVTLDASGTDKLTDASALRAHPRLERLNLHMSSISRLDLTGLPALQHLNVSHAPLTQIDGLDDHPCLTELRAEWCRALPAALISRWSDRPDG